MIQNSELPIPPQTEIDEDYAAEIRFGIVMYGGVSLAIYINGVTSELYQMACATPRAGFGLKNPGPPSTRELYHRIAYLAGNPKLRETYAEKIIDEKSGRINGEVPRDVWKDLDLAACTKTRLVVDVISGTSAGGINGIFLAKALANGEEFNVLKDLWLNEGDIGLLLNDKRSYTGLESIVNRSAQPTSLLNSDRMFIKLRAAMEAMKPLEVTPVRNQASSPLAEELDLFVTTTDIKGTTVPLRLFDKVVHERRHKQSFHFSYPHGITCKGNDFATSNNEFMAFAARCTSSFPFAFEPMDLQSVVRLAKNKPPCQTHQWRGFFSGLSREEVAADAHIHRAFGDGGYLDNKPFSYVVETLSQRLANVPIERKLLYIEPSPLSLDPHARPDPDNPPDALSNSIAALTSIPQYETIREDLQAVLKRNRRIERVERIVRLGEAEIDEHLGTGCASALAADKVTRWADLKLSDLIARHGIAFVPYIRLRAMAVTDSIADYLGRRWGIDNESDYYYALRALVRVWREGLYNDEGEKKRDTISAFLVEFDLEYRLRRIGFLLRKTDQLLKLFYKRRAGVALNEPQDDPPRKPPLLSEVERQLLELIPDGFNPRNDHIDNAQIDSSIAALRVLKANLVAIRVALIEAQCEGDAAVDNTNETAALRGELMMLLGIILDEKPQHPEPPALSDMRGNPVPVHLGAEWEKVASASRTLQESVVLRAEALLRAASGADRTRIQFALEESIETMRMTAGRDRGSDQPHRLNEISHRLWRLLGEPRTGEPDADGKRPIEVDEVRMDPGILRSGERALALLNSPFGREMRRLMGRYYLRFEEFDQISFPLYFDTETGEPATVEIVRVSPRDATNLINETDDALHRRKLAGTALANFGAFLDRRWRTNDAMWGRLDGAERLIQVLLPMSDRETTEVRKALIELAHGRILREELIPNGHNNLTDLLCEALRDTPENKVDAQIKGLLARLNIGDSPSRDRLAGILVSILSEQGLLEYVRTHRTVDPKPDPKTTLQNAARAVNVMGRVLEGVSNKHRVSPFAPRWLARIGLFLQGIVAVSLPGTLKQRWWSHGIKLLYAFELIVALMAILFASQDVRTFALTAIGVTLFVHVLTLVAGDLLTAQQKWIRSVAGLAVCAILALAALGLAHVWPDKDDAEALKLACTTPPDSGWSPRLTNVVCVHVERFSKTKSSRGSAD